MIKKIFTFTFLFLNSIFLFSNHYYYRDNNRIDLRTVPNKHYIHFNKASDVQSVLRNSVQIRAGINENPSWKQQLPNFNITEWAVIKTSEDISNNENILYSSSVYVFPDGSEVPVSHYFYVKLRNQSDTNILKNIANENNVEILGRNEFMLLWYTLSCSKNSCGNALEMANKFYESNLFEYSYPDFMFEYSLNCSNDEYFYLQWNLNNTNAQEYDINLCKAWEITKGGPGVIVAVLDNGTDTTFNSYILIMEESQCEEKFQ